MTDQNNFNRDEPLSNTREPDAKIVREAAKKILDFVSPLVKECTHLLSLTYRTPDEELRIMEIKNTLDELMPYIRYCRDFMGERAYKASVAIYYNAKELAAQGNEEARKIADELKPLFEATLKEGMDEGRN